MSYRNLGRVVAENQKLAFKARDLNVLLVRKTIPKGFVLIGEKRQRFFERLAS